MSATIPTRDGWEFDDECPECGEGVYLAAIVNEMDGEGAIRAKMLCGEEHYRINDFPGIPVEGETRGCGHAWEWERDRER